VRDRPQLSAIFTDLCERVADDLRRKGYVGRTVGIKLRFDDFKVQTRDLTLDQATADATTIRHAAGQCLKRADLSRRLRLLGVRVAALSRADAPPLPASRGVNRSRVTPNAARATLSATALRVAEPGLFDEPPQS